MRMLVTLSDSQQLFFSQIRSQQPHEKLVQVLDDFLIPDTDEH